MGVVNMPKWVKSVFTDGDWDVDLILIAIFVSIMYTCIMTYTKTTAFNPSDFGDGIAKILGGGGLGYAMRRYGDRKNGDSSTSS